MSLTNAALGGLSRNTVPQLARFRVTSTLIGAVTDTSFKISARTAPTERASLTLEVAADPAFTRLAASIAGASTAVNAYWAQFAVTGLTPDTQYYTRVRDGAAVGERAPSVRTLKTGPMSWSMGFGSCCNQGYNAMSFQRILARNPTLFLHMGDFHYADLDGTELTPTPLNDNLANNLLQLNGAAHRTRQADLMFFVPLIAQLNDHDSGTNWNVTRMQQFVHDAYRAMFPSHPLPAAAGWGWYQSCVIGRVRLIVLDVRSFADVATKDDDTTKVLIGAAQWTWMQAELLAAKAANQAIVIAAGNGWCGGYSAGSPLTTAEDGWYDYQFERQRVLDFIAANAITRVCILGGDMHSVVCDSGAYNQGLKPTLPDLIPVYGAAPLHASNSIRGDGWDLGRFPFVASGAAPNTSQYGMLTITDAGGSTLTMTFSGYDAANDSLLVTHSRTLAM